MEYNDFLNNKLTHIKPVGFEPESIHSLLFPFQKDIVKWALKRGRGAIFADCGMGKTIMQLEWARQVCKHTGGKVLMLAPLAVASQTVEEATKIDLDIIYARSQDQISTPITITNYEMLDKFDVSKFDGVVLDESSILKSYDGKLRTYIIEAFAKTNFRLACTATPAPNDFMELGNHAEFLGAMGRAEMLSTFFVHDGGETSKWRLKGHAKSEFWKWVCQWAVMIKKPSDLGYSDDDFVLPDLKHESVVVKTGKTLDGELFAKPSMTLQERRLARKQSLEQRIEAAADIVNSSDEPFLVWCDLNIESQELAKRINDAVEVTGSHDNDLKSNRMLGFSHGHFRVLVTKPSIAGFGMNWQHCNNVMFVGLSDSYEKYYQAVRRCWRFGQKKPVNVYVVSSDLEGPVVANIERKERDAETMSNAMLEFMRETMNQEVKSMSETKIEYTEDVFKSETGNMTLHHGDCVELTKSLPDESVDYTIFSPPFSSLYTYSNSERDMGNCKTNDEFYKHFKYLVDELFRITSSGRLLSFHCMNLPSSKTRDGVIGLKDFRGELIRLFIEAGWIYHSEVVIWKDPVIAMQRTKALGLLHKTIRKDSAMSRQGIPDYLVTMRKPGQNDKPISNDHETFPVSLWQQYASPIWNDINPSDTLQYRSAREHDDEKHICPLQLEVIRRAIKLWSREGDLVFTPFAGIGSELYVALEMKREALGVELKESYFKQAVANCLQAESNANDQLAMGF